jgi:hypothetical protein
MNSPSVGVVLLAALIALLAGAAAWVVVALLAVETLG